MTRRGLGNLVANGSLKGWCLWRAGPIPEVGLRWRRDRAGRPGCGKCGGPARSLGSTAAAAAVGDRRRVAGERRSFFAERWRHGEKLVGLGTGARQGRERLREPSPNVGRWKDGWENGGERGTRLGSGPQRAEPGRGCLQDKGAPERPGLPRRGRGAECAPDARGPGAAGLVLLSPSFAGTCGLGWVPRSGDQGGGGGPGGAALCGKVAGFSCGGTMGARIFCSPRGWAFWASIPHSQLALSHFLSHLPRMDGKVCGGRS